MLLQAMISFTPGAFKSFEVAPPDVNEVPCTFLAHKANGSFNLTNLSSSKIQPAQIFQSPEMQKHYPDETKNFQVSYQHLDLSKEMCPWFAPSAPQGTFFDVPVPIDDMMDKFLDFEMDTPDLVLTNAPTAYGKLPTTLMIRNIPQAYTQKQLAQEWTNNGTYDFFYLPMNHITPNGNKGFAFINFTSAQAAVAFKERWQKQRLQLFQARRTLNITCADVQGRDENMWQLRKGQHWRLQNKECQPLIFENGMHVSFEEGMCRLKACIKGQNACPI